MSGFARVTLLVIVAAALAFALFWLLQSKSGPQAHANEELHAARPITERSAGETTNESDITQLPPQLTSRSVAEPQDAVDADAALLELAGDESRDLQPVFGKLPFTRRHRIPPARELVLDRSLNPHGITLSADQMLKLQELVAAASAHLSRNNQDMSRAGRSWAKLCVENGQYHTVRAGDRIPGLSPEVFTVGFSDVAKGEDRVVIIKPGECAELDTIAFQQAELLSGFYATARKFFSK